MCHKSFIITITALYGSQVPYSIIAIITVNMSDTYRWQRLLYSLIALQLRRQCIIVKYVVNYTWNISSSLIIVQTCTSVIVFILTTYSDAQFITIIIIYLAQCIYSVFFIIQLKLSHNAFTCHNHRLFAYTFFILCQPTVHFYKQKICKILYLIFDIFYITYVSLIQPLIAHRVS